MTFTEIHGNLFDRKLEENEYYVHCISRDWQKPTYDSLREALFDLKELCEESCLNVKTLVMPRIGCGLDKLQWDNVKKMLKEIFEDTDVAIEIYYL